MSSVITRMPAARAFLTVGTIAVESLGTSRMPLAPARDQLLDGGDLAVVVAVELAGVGLRGQAEFLGLGVEALLHLDEERIRVGLGDEADDVGRRTRGALVRAIESAAMATVERIASFLDICSSETVAYSDEALRALIGETPTRLFGSRVHVVAIL